MRTWQTILLGSLVGISADAYFLWPALLSKGELLSSLREKWPELSLIWLVAYGVSVVILCVAYVVRTYRNRWLRAYFLELGKAQYGTAAFVLLGIGLSQMPLTVDVSLPPMLLVRPALSAFAALVITGFIGWLVIPIGLTLSGRYPPSSRADNLETSLREMVASWRATTAAQSPGEDWQKSMLTSLEALVRQTSLLRGELRAVVEDLRASKASEPTQSKATEVAMFHEAARSIEQSVPKLEQVVNTLSAAALSVRQCASMASGPEIAELSSQLDELLRDVSSTPSPMRN